MPGEFGEVRWTWASKDNDLRTGYLPMDGRISITDLIARMAELAPGVDIADINVNWATVTWQRPATSEELEERRLACKRHDERHEEWEKATLVRLAEKYGYSKQGKGA